MELYWNDLTVEAQNNYLSIIGKDRAWVEEETNWDCMPFAFISADFDN